MRSKIFMVCIISVLSAITTYGNPTDKVAPACNKVIKDFIDCHMTSNCKKLDRILNYDANFKIPRGEKVLIQNKNDLIEQMRNDKGTKQNCECNYEVLANSDAMVIARVDFNYGTWIQHNYLILEKNDDKEWKITQVCKMSDMIEDAEIKTGVTASN